MIFYDDLLSLIICFFVFVFVVAVVSGLTFFFFFFLKYVMEMLRLTLQSS